MIFKDVDKYLTEYEKLKKLNGDNDLFKKIEFGDDPSKELKIGDIPDGNKYNITYDNKSMSTNL